MQNNEHGYTLLLVMMIIVVISILGITLMTASSTTSNTVINERTDQSTYYIAEAGINLEKAKIIEIISGLYNTTRQQFNTLTVKQQQQILKTYGSFDHYYNSTISGQFCSRYNTLTNTTKCSVNSVSNLIEYTNQYKLNKQFEKTPISDTKVTLNCNVTPCQFNLTATGYFSDNPNKSRSLKQQVKVDSTVVPETNPENSGNGGENNSPTPENPLENISVLTTGDITLTGSASIEGSSSTLGKVTMNGGSSITGSIHVPSKDYISVPEYMNYFKDKQRAPIQMELNSLLPTFPSDKFQSLSKLSFISNTKEGNYNIIQSGILHASNNKGKDYELKLQPQSRLKAFELSSNQTIYLNIGDQHTDLYVNEWNVSYGHIKIIGSGTLNIYVTDKFIVEGSMHKDGNPNNLNIFYSGKDKLNFNGDANISGTIFAQSANINIAGGAKINGNIYTGGSAVNISGGVATKGQYIVAPNAHLNLTNGGTIYGTVIAKSLEGSGGTKIIYGQPVVPLPTLPTTPQIVVDPKDTFLIESSLLEN